MLFNGRGDRAADSHVGYVAGRYRGGVWSDHWTDVSRCAEHTFTDYAPACMCGWRGPSQKASPDGSLASLRGWAASEHTTHPTGMGVPSGSGGADCLG